MDLLLAAAVGAVVGWLLGRTRTPPSNTDSEASPDRGRRTPKPTKRQREILATLDPYPEPPSIGELMREEAVATGVDRIPDSGLPLHVRLRVWHRDRPGLVGCADGQLRFVVDGPLPDPPGRTPDEAGYDALTEAAADRDVEARVRLVCLDDEPTPPGFSAP
jgi:hypothetical protein